MCGIVGIIGSSNVTEVLVKGLERLEYRGYDSTGIYVDGEEQEFLVKTKGRIKDLRIEMEKTGTISGVRGIGHTRWATHGQPKIENAHPHESFDGRFVLVHNGVIENFQLIKDDFEIDELLVGETDTEIVVHLLAKLVQEKQLTTKEAFLEVLKTVEGSYAFALVDKEDPEKIYVAKNKSPLLVALGKKFMAVCSDAFALLDQTKHFVELRDREIVTLTQDHMVIENYEGVVQSRETIVYAMDVMDMDRGTYDHYMLKEIEEQPAVMRKMIAEYSDEDGEVVLSESIISAMLESDRVYIIACGTSWHAGLVGKHLLEKLANMPTEVHLSSEFGYNTPLLSEKPFFIYLSQSGETADSRQVLVKTNQWDFPSLTVTNVDGSTLAREATYTMLLHAGPEIAVASTKAYTAQIAALTILATSVGRKRMRQDALSFNWVKELSVVANQMDSVLANQKQVEEIVKDVLLQSRNAFYIGRGQDYAVSLEAALKVKEISYIQCEGFASGELKHGTIALIEQDTPVIAIVTSPETNFQTRSNLREVESRGAKTCVIAMSNVAQKNDDLVLPNVHEWLTPLISVVPTQLIAYYATLAKGYDVDKPRNLAKSVTVE